MKFKTTGSFMLVDPQTRVEFHMGIPTESGMTPFVRYRLELGQLAEVGSAPEQEQKTADEDELVTPAPEQEQKTRRKVKRG